MSTAALPLAALPSPQVQQLATLTEQLDGASLWWLSGYAAGLARRSGGAAAQPLAAAPAAAAEPTGNRLTIVYGSQTGNAKQVAETLARQVEANGLAVRLLRADAYPQRELAKERLLYVVISTQGDGDAPDDARGFLDFLASRRAPQLKELAFAVLGLGDTSYPQFCVIGRKLDERLAELGGKRLFDFGAADLDIETVAEPWSKQALEQARGVLHTTPSAPLASVTPLRPHAEAEAWSAKRPFQAELIANQRLTSRESDKDVRHIELDLAGAGLDYAPGDALGVLPHNPPRLIASVLEALKLDGNTPLAVKGETLPLAGWLDSKRELTKLSRPFVSTLAEHTGHAELKALLEPGQTDALRQLLENTQPIDLIERYRPEWNAEQLVAALRPLAPRLYSIASSRAAVGDEVHLTVAHVEYEAASGTRWGAASHWLASREEGQQIDVYLQRNERFHLPKDASRDVIMVGPGTGVAPFRAFVQERAEAGASGRNWLFFGNPHFRHDFLYQTEWQAALKQGTLSRLDLAFSRDQADKVYVQQRLREQGRELYAWLEAGAQLYVCGALSMARDVDRALRDVITEHGGRSAEDADAYLAQLRDTHRYAQDVY